MSQVSCREFVAQDTVGLVGSQVSCRVFFVLSNIRVYAHLVGVLLTEISLRNKTPTFLSLQIVEVDSTCPTISSLLMPRDG